MPTFTKFSELPPEEKKRHFPNFTRSLLLIFTEKSPPSEWAAVHLGSPPTSQGR